MVEPKYPGLVEQYVNLGACYQKDGLQSIRQELMSCMKGYKGCYQRAYRCLGAAAEIFDTYIRMCAYNIGVGHVTGALAAALTGVSEQPPGRRR